MPDERDLLRKLLFPRSPRPRRRPGNWHTRARPLDAALKGREAGAERIAGDHAGGREPRSVRMKSRLVRDGPRGRRGRASREGS